MKCKTVIIFLLYTTSLFAQELEFVEKELTIPSKKVDINGTLIIPEGEEKFPLIIIIPGSGNTDRNGNIAIMKNNSLKFLSESLTNHKMASYRYDKSTIALAKKEGLHEKDVFFSDFIDNAIDVIDYFKAKELFSKIIIAGHSQGSLVGMIAAQGRADGFISLAGAGRSIDEILLDQLGVLLPSRLESIQTTLDSLKLGKMDMNYDKMLGSIFRESVQPFLISWIKYEPQKEIEKLSIPILIVNGTKDSQVPISDANLLHEANADSQLEIIENMNHIFKEVKGGKDEDRKTYIDSKLPVMTELTEVIVKFVNTIK